uniref:CSON007597 protein n=1 Tax=Culicoides sonorensis TaxID=179676 RepID=A0A336MYH6_CULSO
MADSFFGFNTTLPMDDDGGGDLEPPEEDYDALNDETFGDAREGDWENLHENLVRMSTKEFGGSTTKSKQNGSIKSEDDDDLDFSRFNFDDLDMGGDDNDIKLQLDPSVWAAPSTLHQQKSSMANAFSNNFDPNTFLRQHFSQPLTLLQQQQQKYDQMVHEERQRQHYQQQQQQHQQQQQLQQENETIDILATLMKQAPKPQAPLKIVSVDELERNILMQQQKQQQSGSQGQQQQTQRDQQETPKMQSVPQKVPGSPAKSGLSNIQPPPGMGSPRQHPMFNQGQMQQPPHPMMANNQGNKNNRNNFPMPPQMMPARPPNMQMPQGGAPGMPPPRNMPPMNMPPHPMNNFNQMPPFGPMNRGGPMPAPHFGPGPNMGGAPPGMRGPPPPPGHPLSQFYNQNQQQNSQNSVKQFNMKLMEEIQQNHPMLQQLNRMHGGHHHNLPGPNNMHNNQNGHFHHGGHQNNPNNRQNQQHINNGNNNNNNKYHTNGNVRQEPQDPYANLMSNRDKQWLISIQLMQLNTETPYFDDFYFTVFKEKKAKSENRAYNNNQLNHPFNQGPKGHAHNMLMQAVANKNGMNNNNRNGHMHNRERKNSESHNGKNDGGNKETGAKSYTPLQFENSLGKLQVGCGSVTAPRKIIDMEVVSAEPINHASIIELNTQRKSSRTLLLHIETLYKILLLLEDLENPVAIAAAQILKQKREKERTQALEQAAIAKAIAEANGEEVSNIDPATLSLPSDKYPLPQTHDELVPKLLAGLTPEKALLRRAMPLIKDEPQRWTIWYAIFASLNIILKKEREIDPNVILLYEEFQKHLQFAKLENVVQISKAFVTPDKKMNFLFNNKRIGLPAIIALILHAESLYSNKDYTRNEHDEKQWEDFLLFLTTHAATLNLDVTSNGGQNQTIDSQILKNLIQHLTRFSSLQTKPLLNILTQVDGNSAKK